MSDIVKQHRADQERVSDYRNNRIGNVHLLCAAFDRLLAEAERHRDNAARAACAIGDSAADQVFEMAAAAHGIPLDSLTDDQVFDAPEVIADLRAKLAAAEKDKERLSRLWGCDLSELLANAVAADERDAAIARVDRLAAALREIAVQAMRGLMTTSISEANEVASIVCDIARAALADSDAKEKA